MAIIVTTLSNLVLRDWRDISNEIFIPTAENGGVPGYEAVYPNITGTNEQPIQFRIRTVIMNEYNGEKAFSRYTYMSMVNNIPIADSINSIVYPSLYPLTTKFHSPSIVSETYLPEPVNVNPSAKGQIQDILNCPSHNPFFKLAFTVKVEGDFSLPI